MLAEIDNIELNDRQDAIVEHIHGGLLVLAPVGTGKTLVLAERAANAVRAGIDPKRILCLTFTNRAAKEMLERIKRLFPQYSSKITVTTFHALCADMLLKEAKTIGLPHDFVVYDEDDSVDVFMEIGNITAKEARDCYYKTEKIKSLATSESSLETLIQKEGNAFADLAVQYHAALQLRHGLDFQDLVFRVRAMLVENQEIRDRWQNRYDFVQVDEVQDTHSSEYEIVKALAIKSCNLALIGDFDQTIYEWRGSNPDKIISEFKEDFAPVKTLTLRENYRSTRILQRAFNAFARNFDHGSIICFPADTVDEGELIAIKRLQTGSEEANWIAKIVLRLYKAFPGMQFNRVGVLTRTNYRGMQVSEVFEKLDIPHVTVEQYHFFSRQEIKDTLAHLKVLINPRDKGSLMRFLRRSGKGIGEATINQINGKGPEIGLFLSDLIAPKSFDYDDPFEGLFHALDSGSVVIIDVETTGLDIDKNDVIEIAAQKIQNGQVIDEFQTLLKTDIPVRDSEEIHGYSDEYLEKHGIDAVTAYQQFMAFAGDSVMVGHNIQHFDVPILKSHSNRLLLTLPDWEIYDTLDLAHRFIDTQRYDLFALSKTLNLSKAPTHKAMDDVQCTKELLFHLLPLAREKSAERQELVTKHAGVFKPVTEKISHWKKQLNTMRPAEFLPFILSDSGLEEYYSSQPRRLANLEMLKQFFIEKEQAELSPESALRDLIKLTALSRNIDFLSETDNRIPIITVHQAKGLEFDTVFIAGATEGEFPSYFALRDDKLDEEMRVFYVAMTRAKQRLFISSFAQNRNGYSKNQCRFIEYLGSENLRVLSKS